MTKKRFAAVLAAATWLTGGSAAADLEVGSHAPEFSLPGSDGQTHRHADHVGKRAVVLAWFPKAFTPG